LPKHVVVVLQTEVLLKSDFTESKLPSASFLPSKGTIPRIVKTQANTENAGAWAPAAAKRAGQ